MRCFESEYISTRSWYRVSKVKIWSILQGARNAVDGYVVFGYSGRIVGRWPSVVAFKEKIEMSIASIVLGIHSLVRFVILIIAVVGVVVSLASMGNRKQGSLDKTLASAFVGLYDLQALLGILIILVGQLTQAIHPIVMFIGLVAAHGLQSMTRREGSNAAILRVALFVVPLLIILVGLYAIGHLPV